MAATSHSLAKPVPETFLRARIQFSKTFIHRSLYPAHPPSVVVRHKKHNNKHYIVIFFSPISLFCPHVYVNYVGCDQFVAK